MRDTAIKRDDKGRLLPGHGLKSPGRPRREVERAYAEITYQMVTPQAWARIVSKAVEDAMNGDSSARIFIANLLGFKRDADPFETVNAPQAGDALTTCIEFARESERRANS